MHRTPRALLALLLPLALGCETKEPETEPEEEPIPDEFTFYADSDGDGFGNPDVSLDAAEQPSGYVTDATDCNDGRADINPDADEVCDDLDNNCNGDTDEDAVDAETFYADSDGDGYGDADAATAACEQPSDHVTDSTDCNDALDSQHPDADELCNQQDDDCDGDTDEDAIDAGTWYADADGDGYGDAATGTTSCEQPSDLVADDTDCDDADSEIHPGAEDIADGLDQDCDAADGFIFSEDFESYAVGDYIAYSSYNFETWTAGSEGGTEDVPVTDEVTYSTGTRALVLSEDGGDDLVLTLGPSTGSWLVEWYMYVDTGAYFNLQGMASPFGDWQQEVHIDDLGYIYADGSDTGYQLTIGEWVLVEYAIDLDNMTQDLTIEGMHVVSDDFTGMLLGGIDFYPTKYSSEQTETVVFYLDSFVFSQL